MSDDAKIVQLFKTPAEELVKIEPAEWDGVFSNVHGEDLRLL
jgi:hypothetical protein